MADSFNSPKFLACTIKRSLLSPNAGLMEAYEVCGKLLKDEPLRKKRRAIAKTSIADLLDGIESMSSAELITLRERVTGVLKFPGAKR